MSADRFDFKRFGVEQSSSAMKVGTDGVLIGAWARFESRQERILDIGTGTGLIALMAAQRTEQCGSMIDAVEIDERSARQAERNVAASPWGDRITIHNLSLQEFAAHNAAEQYDHIVSNPPYFVNSMPAPDQRRSAARHTCMLSFGELTGCSAALLKRGGRLSVIVPVESGRLIAAEAYGCGFQLSRRCLVSSKQGSRPIREMLEFVRHSSPTSIEDEELSLRNNNDFTDDYRVLTEDFYLGF